MFFSCDRKLFRSVIGVFTSRIGKGPTAPHPATYRDDGRSIETIGKGLFIGVYATGSQGY